MLSENKLTFIDQENVTSSCAVVVEVQKERPSADGRPLSGHWKASFVATKWVMFYKIIVFYIEDH